ncbi:MAG: DegT/DnrJ/EryC1/StrS family aminotransferase [Candidatus Brennerbacteria bacterium]|nr:DegT/DnrJ/EryC1/StrS family aminotransferase [Candidatus Brennerbacteria bacterium]
MRKKQFRAGKDWIWYAPNTTDVFGEKEIRAVEKTLRAGWLTTGKVTAEFERKIAKLFGKKYGLFVNSGSSANLLAFAASKFSKGSEVITPACTFNTTIAPIVQMGLVPVLVDVVAGKYTLNTRELEKARSRKTVAVMVPHLIGNFVDMVAVRAFCRKHELVFIEDSCDTIGGLYHGKPSGMWSDIVTTSFYASHLVTAGGAGGMLMTNDKKLRERARVIRDWGRGISRHDEKIRSRLATFRIDGKPYDSAFVFVERGYNFRPTEMQAAFALEQLKRLSGFAAARRRNFKVLHSFFRRYEEFFILPEELPKTRTNWLAFPLTLREGAPFKRNDLVRYLEDHKIQTRPLFSGNVLKQPAYRGVSHRVIGKLPHSNLILRNSFLIGVHHGITQEMLDYLFRAFEAFVVKYDTILRGAKLAP